MKMKIFTAVKYCYILHSRVSIMNVNFTLFLAATSLSTAVTGTVVEALPAAAQSTY